MRWVKKWTVLSNSDPDKYYTVSQADDGTCGCSCRHWIFRRKECSHIAYIKTTKPEPNSKPRPKPTIIPAKVSKPTYDEKDNLLLMPLIHLDPYDISTTALICYVAMQYGYTITELRERYHLPQSWTKRAIIEYVESRGLHNEV